RRGRRARDAAGGLEARPAGSRRSPRTRGATGRGSFGAYEMCPNGPSPGTFGRSFIHHEPKVPFLGDFAGCKGKRAPKRPYFGTLALRANALHATAAKITDNRRRRPRRGARAAAHAAARHPSAG